MSIAWMEADVQNQLDDLVRFADELGRGPVNQLESAGTIFTGSGDSYAAALFAQDVSNHSTLAMDPYELLMKPTLVRRKNLVLISVSGRTRTGVDLARAARREARTRIAITAYPESPLAKSCDSTIIIKYGNLGRLTSGTSSFTTSLLACAHLIGVLPKSLRLQSSLQKARQWAGKIVLSSHGLTIFIGSSVDRALAEYGACKIQEVLGTRATAQYPEQLGHAILFSLDPSHDRIICLNSLRRAKTSQLAQAMSRSGFKVHTVPSTGPDIVSKSLAASFHLQYLALLNAKRLGLTQVAFLRNKMRLNLSNRLIY